jgi:phenylalanyl-tRNA synthetase beta chain
MRVPLSWLADYVDVALTPAQLAERLTLLGMEVKGIEAWGSDWRNVVVGELLTVEKHPRADRLSLTTVTLGDGSEPLEIVCGATNIAPGQRVPVALPGAVLPGDRRIERTEKMGVVSNGMLCSGDELNMTADADGILILPPDTPLGRPLVELYGDTVLDVDVKPNRGDALSLVGLAREVAAVTGTQIRFPETAPPESGDPVDRYIDVEVRDTVLCPRFVGRWVGGVTMGPSPDRVQMRLRAAGVRPISNVVDTSNYVMLELGKPIHTYDASGVATADDGRHRLIVRRAEPGERIETLDHVERTLDPETLLITDARGPVGIAGVMGDTPSEIKDTTTDVIVESAIFDPVSIRRTGQRFALRSEASLRFEKGQEFRLARLGADRAARLIAEWAGGTVAVGSVDTNPVEPEPSRIAFRPSRVNRLLGTSIPEDQQRELLARVGIATEPLALPVEITVSANPRPQTVTSREEALSAIVPTWRRDIAIEADVTEEVARVRGYETIPEILPDTPMPTFRDDPLDVRDAIRETLAGAGITEVVTHALVAPRIADAFRWESPLPTVEGEAAEGGRPILVTNPLSADHSVLRPALVGSLVQVVSTNLRHGVDDVAIFEIGKGYGADGGAPAHGDGEGAVREWWRLGLAATGTGDEAAFNRPARPYDLDDAKGAIALLASRLGFDEPTFRAERGEPLLHPGRAARVEARRNGQLVLAGIVGELHPTVVDAWDLRDARVIVAELDLTGLGGGRREDVTAAPPPRHPASERDLAVVVNEDVAAGDVAAAIRDNGGSALRELRLFDVYRGSPLATDEKSLAYRLTFRAADRTLEEAEVESAIAAITAGLSAGIGARIRT